MCGQTKTGEDACPIVLSLDERVLVVYFDMREVIEDTLDHMAAWCGLQVPQRPPRQIRRAVRALASATPVTRINAERELSAARDHAAPLLRQVAHSPERGAHALRAAMLLHRLQEKDGADLLRLMVRDSRLRCGPHSDLLRRAVSEIVNVDHYVLQANSAVTHLEQRPESFKAIVRFRHAIDIMHFLQAPMPTELLHRALVVRIVGGENLSLVREVLQETAGVSVEHVCMVRKEAARSLVRSCDPETAFSLLAENLRHPNPAVKLTAMFGLQELGDDRAIGPLLLIANNIDSPVQIDARRLVEFLDRGSPDALTLLRAATQAEYSPDLLLRPLRLPADHLPGMLLRPDVPAECYREQESSFCHRES